MNRVEVLWSVEAVCDLFMCPFLLENKKKDKKMGFYIESFLVFLLVVQASIGFT